VITDLEPPRPLPPILPGYRPPFNSETGRAAGKQSAANTKAEREQFRKLGLDKLLKPKRPRDLLLAVQKAIMRHANASAEPNLPDCGTAHARNAKLFHDIFQSLHGINPSLRSMRSKSRELATPSSFPMPDSGSNSPIQSTTPPNQNASGAKAGPQSL
jgi:hypothetical protein